MICGLKPYLKMKDSGVPWLGEIPEHWEVKRIRNVIDMRVSNVDKHTKDSERPVRLCNYVDVYKNDRIRDSMLFMNASATYEEIERFCLVPGDVLITKDSETWNDIGIPAFVESSSPDLVCGYHLAILKPFPNQMQGSFLFRVLQSINVAAQFHVEANGVTRFGLSHAAIKSVCLPIPSLPEQAAIVKFIDHYDRKIRRYIRTKQKLIKLLEEQKQTIIHRAVTGQIDVRTGKPYPSYKPSGVEWLGDVPEHWEVVALRLMYEQCLGKMLDSKRITGSDLIPYLRNTDVHWENINVSDLPMMDIAPSEYSRYTVRLGDLLVCEGGEVGRAAIWSDELEVCGFQKALHRLRPRKSDSQEPRFMYFVLKAACNCNVFSDGHVSTIAHLTGNKLRSHRFAFPSTSEQVAIVEYLNRATADIDTAITRTRREIELLREYRTRLIADVVTGKLDVREAAARLPDEPEEPEPLETADELVDADDPAENEDLAEALPEEVEA